MEYIGKCFFNICVNDTIISTTDGDAFKYVEGDKNRLYVYKDDIIIVTYTNVKSIEMTHENGLYRDYEVIINL